jgi:hypothetical protein
VRVLQPGANWECEVNISACISCAGWGIAGLQSLTFEIPDRPCRFPTDQQYSLPDNTAVGMRRCNSIMALHMAPSARLNSMRA